MKKSLTLALAIVSLISLQGCKNDTTSTDTIDQEITENSGQYTLAQVGGEASCLRYKLYDANNNLIEVPADLAEVFECPQVTELSPDTQKVMYENSTNELKLFEIPSKTETKITDLDPNSFGNTCRWSPEGDTIACVMVNQEEYPNMTKVLVFFGFEDGEGPVFKREYDQSMAFTCGSICAPDVFEFDGNSKLKFELREENGDKTPSSLDISL